MFKRKQEVPTFPCAACGFVVFFSPGGGYEVCPVCDWEDDEIQLRFPGLAVGANQKCLYDHQGDFLSRVPPEITEYGGRSRDLEWRPLKVDERTVPSEGPQSGREYFDSLTGSVPYYWRR
jgi:hypothetical protein